VDVNWPEGLDDVDSEVVSELLTDGDVDPSGVDVGVALVVEFS
jgi:hypothetical protein